VHETRVADLTRLLRIQAFVTGTTTTISTRHRSVSEPVGPENGFSRLHSVLRRVSSDPGPASADPFRYPRPTSASPGHDTGPLLLGASHPTVASGWLPAPPRAKSHRGLLRPERPFDVTLGWPFTPGLVCEGRDDQRASSPRNRVLLDPADQPLVGTGWLCMTTPPCAFTCVIHSHRLGVSLRSARSLSPSLPCTPPLDDQSHNVGRRSYLTTAGVGVAPTWTRFASCERDLLLPAFPLYLAYSFRQTDRTPCAAPDWRYALD